MKIPLTELVQIRVDIAELAQAVGILSKEIKVLNPGVNLEIIDEAVVSIMKRTYRNENPTR